MHRIASIRERNRPTRLPQRFNVGLSVINGRPKCAIELLALGEADLLALLVSLDTLDTDRFAYMSVHAPVKLDKLTEEMLALMLMPIAQLKWPIIVHADMINDVGRWAALGQNLCIENMGSESTVGRTVEELLEYFRHLPEAGFCLNLSHAHQIDSSMDEARRMTDEFATRVRQVHTSGPFRMGTSVHHSQALYLRKVERVLRRLPETVPVIVEVEPA